MYSRSFIGRDGRCKGSRQQLHSVATMYSFDWLITILRRLLFSLRPQTRQFLSTHEVIVSPTIVRESVHFVVGFL